MSTNARRIHLSLNHQYDFFITLDTMLQAGLSLQDALEVNLELEKNSMNYRISRQLHASVSRGKTFSGAIQESNFEFLGSVPGIIRAGEEIGDLSKVLSELCDFLKQRKALNEKLSTASIYPTLVLSMLLIGLILFTAFFTPSFVRLIQPIDPEAAIKLSRSLNATFLIGTVLVSFIVLFLGVHRAYLRQRNGDDLPPLLQTWESMLIHLPLVKTAFIEQDLLQLYFILRILSENGVSLERAIATSIPTLNLNILRSQFTRTAGLLQRGVPLSTSLQKSVSILPHRVISWIKISERTGNPQTVFEHLYEHQKAFMENFLNRIMSLLEPAMTILTGVILLAVVLQFMVPFISIYTKVI